MKSKILSLNVGGPQVLEWNGKTTTTSMLKNPINGPLIVRNLTVDGDSFANPKFHGTPDSVLYIYGMSSVLPYMKSLGRDVYPPGALGENVTVDEFDESKMSVGDIFKIGQVVVQATFPRIPCAKVNIRMQHESGQKLMQQSGRSGVYMRVLEPGQILISDKIERIESANPRFTIFR